MTSSQPPAWAELVQLVPIVSFALPFVSRGEVDIGRAATGFVVGAVLAVAISLLLVRLGHVQNPILIGTGLWLCLGALAFNVPLPALARWLASTQAFGLFVAAFGVGLVTTMFSPAGYIGCRQGDASWVRRASVALLLATGLVAAWAFWFRTDVRIGGGLPFIVLNVTRRIMIRRAPRSVAAMAALFATCVGAAPASAQPWIEGRAGAGVTSGHFEFEKEYQSSTTGQPAIAHAEGGPFGIAIALGVVGGYALNRQFALGLTGRLELAPYVEEATPLYSTVDAHLLAAAGSTFAFRPTRSLELRVAPEWAFARFTGSTLDIGADDNVYEHENVDGPGLGFSFSYCSEPGWGFATAVNVARLSSEHTSFTLLTVTLLASYSTW